jgi:catechol 2,3-dioxygenase-like lactoylglutathione lyase family enzyme
MHPPPSWPAFWTSLAQEWGPFVPIHVANRVTLQFMTAEHVSAQHCAFLMTDPEFASAMDRIRTAGLTYWADPLQQRENEIDDGPGGRKVYFLDPSHHLMEILTAPAG